VARGLKSGAQHASRRNGVPLACAYQRGARLCTRPAWRLVEGVPCCSRHWQALLREALERAGRAVVTTVARLPD